MRTEAWHYENDKLMLFTQDQELIARFKGFKVFATYYNKKWKVKKAIQYILPVELKYELKEFIIKERRSPKRKKVDHNEKERTKTKN